MPVPKRKRSRARRDKRFANKGLQVKAVASCQNCKTPLTPHQACKMCGHYKGVKVMVTKIERAIKRGEAKKAKQGKEAAAPVTEPPVEQVKE